MGIHNYLSSNQMGYTAILAVGGAGEAGPPVHGYGCDAQVVVRGHGHAVGHDDHFVAGASCAVEGHRNVGEVRRGFGGFRHGSCHAEADEDGNGESEIVHGLLMLGWLIFSRRRIVV